MKAFAGVGLLAAALWLGGCQEEGEQGAVEREEPGQTPYEEEFTTADTSEAYGTDAAAPVVPVQGQAGGAVMTVTEEGPLTATGNLQGLSPNAPPGSVVITQAGQGTQVRIKIDRYTPGSRLQASIVQGDCQRPGSLVADVGQPFTVEQSGFATLIASVAVPTPALLNGQHSLRVTNPDATPSGADAPQMVLACAKLPRAGR